MSFHCKARREPGARSAQRPANQTEPRWYPEIEFMAISTRSYARPYVSGGGLPPGVRGLLIANCVVFLAQFLLRGPLGGVLSYFELVPREVVKSLYVWQLVSYMFIHLGILHLVFNMLALWWFGRELEELWGTRAFLRFYFICGGLAGVCVVLATYLFGNPAMSHGRLFGGHLRHSGGYSHTLAGPRASVLLPVPGQNKILRADRRRNHVLPIIRNQRSR